jgi:glycosyltransferase involved in cell wall biosynthesis
MLIGVDASRAVVRHRTGTEFYSLHLIDALLALDTCHRFRLYFNRMTEESALPWSRRHTNLTIPPRLEIRVIPFPRLWTHLRLGLEVAVDPPTVLYVPSHVLPRWTRIPSVVTVHDLGYLFYPAAHPWRQRWYLNWSTRHNARSSTVVIADSEATRADLVAHYSIPESKIVVAYPSCDADLAPISDPAEIDAVKRRYDIRDDYFLHIGTLHPRKNLARLIEAFAGLPRSGSVQLVLAGKKGWLYDHLIQLVRRLGLQDRVLFPGYVDDADKASLISGALAYVFPSLYEGFGFPVLEAQACETPLICANVSSLPEVAGDGALLIDPINMSDLTQAMARVLNDEDLRTSLISRGQRNRKRFSWQSCAETVMQALEAAVKL